MSQFNRVIQFADPKEFVGYLVSKGVTEIFAGWLKTSNSWGSKHKNVSPGLRFTAMTDRALLTMSASTTIPNGWSLEGDTLTANFEGKASLVRFLLDQGVEEKTINKIKSMKATSFKELLDSTPAKPDQMNGSEFNQVVLTLAETRDQVKLPSNVGPISVRITESSGGKTTYQAEVDWAKRLEKFNSTVKGLLCDANIDLLNGVIE